MLTGVERVALDFGTRWQRDMARLTVSDARRRLESGEFPPGSMGPKIESGVSFVDEGGRAAVIVTAPSSCLPPDAGAGTRIVPDAEAAASSTARRAPPPRPR